MIEIRLHFEIPKPKLKFQVGREYCRLSDRNQANCHNRKGLLSLSLVY